MTDSGQPDRGIDTSVPGGRFVVRAMAPAIPHPPRVLSFRSSRFRTLTSAAAGWNTGLLVSSRFVSLPAAGLAWSLPDSPKTVAARRFWNLPQTRRPISIFTNLAQNLPFFLTKDRQFDRNCLAPFTTENALTASPTGTVGGKQSGP